MIESTAISLIEICLEFMEVILNHNYAFQLSTSQMKKKHFEM